jgi:HAD superfamily hydrolase (TIGR01450 family)
MKERLLNKKLFVFDMDGTLFLGNRVFPFAVDFLRRLREHGYRILFFTNNASHDPAYYLDKLTCLGFSPSREEILTSGDVTIQFLLTHRKGKSCYLVGTPALCSQFDEAGILRSGTADIVVTSFDTTLTYEKLDTACRLIRGGAEYLSTHPDYNCPTETGFIPDSGAIAAFVTASTGVSPTYFGKPYKETIEMIGEATGFKNEEMCIFGDRLYTDIALGKKFGVTAALVLSGETKMNDVDAAKPEDKPDFVFNSLDDLNNLIFKGENQ